MPQYQGVWTLPVAARLQSTQQWATDPLYRNTTLLLQADNAPNGAQNNTFIDSSSNNFTITRNGNTTQGTFTPYSLQPGAWSNFFNGATDYLSVADNAAFEFGGNNFTIEMWVYPTSTNQYQTFIGKDSAAGTRGFILTSDTQYLIFANAGGALVQTTKKFIPNQWNFLTITRSSNTIYLGINGIVESFAWTATIPDAASPLTIASQLTPGGVYVNYFPGYISNLRVVNGSSVATYQANFTPSTSPLTAIANTSLLTCQSNRFVDNSTNNFTITPSGTPSVQAFSPFAPQYQWTAPVIGGSGYFDGTGDYLEIADNTAWDVGSGNFTIECWFYPLASGQSMALAGNWSSTVQANRSYLLYVFTDNLVYFIGDDASTVPVASSASTIIRNAWNHVAAVRNGTSLRVYLNGVSGTSVTLNPFTFQNSNLPFRIGDVSQGTSLPVNGYITDTRYIKGTAQYTANFTPPTAPLTAVTNTQLLCNYTNAGIYDGTMKNNLETVGNAQVNTSVVKYGTGSMAFDGTGDWCLVPSSQNFNMGTGDWTVECWAYASASTARGLFQITTGFLNSTLTGIGVGISTTSGNPWRVYHGTTNTDTTLNATIGVWNHVAFVRFNGAVRLYINGASVYSATDTSNLSTYTFLTVGAWYDSSFPWNGYIDDFRITKGIARYTANFTPPTVALPRQ